MNILSVFDGMACGMIAMLQAGVKVDRYVAYEIDKYAVKTSKHNFPIIEHMGDVFQADFTQYEGFDFLVGGSPCTYWSIAQKNGRETEASGLGWELFSQYVRALKEAKPRFFIYENNKSMSKAIRDSIRDTFGFEEICINSALVSAQNRQRYYWVGKYNPKTDWYDRVNVQQPKDRGILLKDVLDGAITWKQKQGTIDANYFKGGNFSNLKKQSGQRFCVAEQLTASPVLNLNHFKCPQINNGDISVLCDSMESSRSLGAERIPEYGNVGKSRPVRMSYAYKGSGEGSLATEAFPDDQSKQVSDYVAEPLIDTNGKSFCITATEWKGSNPEQTLEKHRRTMVAEPIVIPTTKDDKANALTSSYYKAANSPYSGFGEEVRRPRVAEPVCVAERGRYNESGEIEQHIEARPDGKTSTVTTVSKDNMCAEPVNTTADGKSQTIKRTYHFTSTCNVCCYHSTYGASGVAEPVSKYSSYAVPCECNEQGEPTKAISGADGKTYTVYSVADGQITIKGKTYPIKLIDGYYIIRKLTVSECKRLQTVPEWYEFPVSNTQAYKMLGNGWTVEVIMHLIRSCL